MTRIPLDFDRLAVQWDNNPGRLQLISTIGTAIGAEVDLKSCATALEVGCGTGTLALLLSAEIGHILATDASAGMIAKLREKLASHAPGNITAGQMDLLKGDSPNRTFDLVYTAMALHHVADTSRFLTLLLSCLNPEGTLFIADLCEEDGSFHGPDMDVPHNGFSEVRIRKVVTEAGGRVSAFRTIYTVEKSSGSYPVFLATVRHA